MMVAWTRSVISPQFSDSSSLTYIVYTLYEIISILIRLFPIVPGDFLY